MIGIISYLPQDTELRTVRKKNATIQMEWLKNLFPDETPFVIAQGYTKDDMQDGVEYDVYENGIGSHNSRNKILEKFYNGDDEWLFMMDDDVLSYNYYESDKFVSDVYYGRIKLNTDMILPLQPETSPFKELNMKNDVAHYYILSKSSATNCPNMMLLHKNEHRVFFDNTINLLAEDAIPDDNKFVVNCIALGMRVHRADFWIKKSLDRLRSVIYSADKDENFEQHALLGRNLKKYVVETYNVKSTAEFNQLYNKTVPIRLEREEVYDVPETLLPKNRANTNKRLF